MIGVGHYSEPWVIAIEPGIVSLDLNGTSILVERGGGNKSSRKSGTTSFVSVIEARWRVFVHISGADYVVDVHPHLVLEIRVLGMNEWLKYAISSLGVDLVNGLFW
jgi:hypothetical protein